MQVGIAEAVAFLALVASVGSVFYAKQASDAARKGNRINLNQPRKEIFEALFGFRRLFVDLDLHPTEDEIQQFYVGAVLPAHLYLPAPLLEEMYRIYKVSMELYRGIVKAEASDSSSSKWELTEALQKLGKEDLDALIRRMAAEYNVGDT